MKKFDALPDRALDRISGYAPPMGEEHMVRIKELTLLKVSDKKPKRAARAKARQVLAIAVCLCLFVTSAVAVNAVTDLTFLLEPVLGTSAAEHIQGIHKKSMDNGILMEVEAAYNDENTAYVFFSLTDTEGKGRITGDMFFDRREFSRILVPFNTYGFSDVKLLDFDQDAQKAWFYTVLSTANPNEDLSGKLVQLKLENIVTTLHWKTCDTKLDAYQYLFGGSEDKLHVAVPTPSNGVISGLGFTDFTDGTADIGSGFQIRVEYPEDIPLDQYLDEYFYFYDADGNVYGCSDRVSDTGYHIMRFEEITSIDKLKGLKLAVRYLEDRDIIEGAWQTTFRLSEEVQTKAFTVNESFDGGVLQTVEISPTRVRFVGELLKPDTFALDLFEWSVISASGAEIRGANVSSAWQTEGSGAFYIQCDGLIPEDIVSVEFAGIHLSLN